MWSVREYSHVQFRLVRILLGIFIVYLFYGALGYEQEVFGPMSWYQMEYSVFPLLGFFYLALQKVLGFSPLFVMMVFPLIGLVGGIFPRLMSLLTWFSIVVLLGRNNYFHDFDLDFVGWLLLLFSIIPNGKEMPRIAYSGAWLVLSVAYCLSGIHKLQSDFWLGGDAIYMVLQGPLGYWDYGNLFDYYPVFVFCKILNWFVLLVEVFFIFSFIWEKWALLFWLAMTVVHIGIASTLALSSLNVAVLIFHLFLFNPQWRFLLLKNWLT